MGTNKKKLTDNVKDNAKDINQDAAGKSGGAILASVGKWAGGIKDKGQAVADVIRNKVIGVSHNASDVGDGRKNQASKDENKKNEKPGSQKDRSKPQYDIKKMRADLNRKNDLEQNITLLIGGKTGMIMMWENLIEAAAAGEVSNFRFYGTSFMRKAEPMEKFRSEIWCLTKEYKRQSKTIGKCKNPEAAEMIRLLTLPYKDRQICKELSDKSQRLKESGFLEASSVSEEALTEWGKRVQKEFSQPADKKENQDASNKGDK